MVTKILGAITASSPGLKRRMWKQWYEFLARGYQVDEWTCMNYGYADPKGNGPRLDPADEPERYGIQLYHAVATGGADLRGRRVLEVGSGRGGGSSYIARYLGPERMLGIDYSDNAVALSIKRHAGVANLSFKQGDAEALPVGDGEFDAVVNVESSHCYGSMERFLGEVARVLRPGGDFLWADMTGRDGQAKVEEQFRAAGLTVRHSEDITANVLLALDSVKERKESLIGSHVPAFLRRPFADFAGVPGTRVYESLRAGDVRYRRIAARKAD